MLLRILDMVHLLIQLYGIMFGSAIASLLFTENPQIMVAIAGGVCAAFGAAVVTFTRKKNKEKISPVKQL
jgi:positive regulator of sigma E activity